MSTNRLEAFSDGVIAVAITLLVLNLPAVSPAHPRPDLAAYLGGDWPAFVAYVVSFVTIGIVWINHHSMVSRLARADHVILVVNLLLLMTIVLLPFTTNLMAAYLKRSGGEHLAAGIYAGSFFLMSLTFATLNWNILISRHELLGEEMSEAARWQLLRRMVGGIAPYVVAIAIAPVSPYATLAICGVVAFYYALPIASGR